MEDLAVKSLAEGGLPQSSSEVVIWFDEEDHQVTIQYDNFDINLFADDFARLADIIGRAASSLEDVLSGVD